MGVKINRKMLVFFYGVTKNLVEGKASGIGVGNTKIKIRGLDLDAYNRRMRLFARAGYFKVQKGGSYDIYTMAPKGYALYDCIAMYCSELSSQPPSP